MNGLWNSDNVQDGNKFTQDVTSTTNTADGCKQTYNHKHNEQTTRVQEAKQNKQPTRDSPDTQSERKDGKIRNTCERDVPCTDKFTDVQGQANNSIIFEEFVGGSQHGALNCSSPMERSAEGNNELVAAMDNTGGSSIIDRIAGFIVNAYLGSCGRLRFRDN